MDLSTYAGLQAAALEFMERSGQTAQAPGWITLAEAKLNRKLGPVETDAALTGVVDSREIDLSTLAIVQPIALFLTEPGGSDERELQQQASVALAQDSGRPTQWVMKSRSSIDLDRPCDMTYGFRFRYRERFALSDAVTSNWLLANHPDIYLAATMMWGAGYSEDWANGQVWKGLLDEGLEEVGQVIAEGRRGVLRVDTALSSISGRDTSYGWDGVS